MIQLAHNACLLIQSCEVAMYLKSIRWAFTDQGQELLTFISFSDCMVMLALALVHSLQAINVIHYCIYMIYMYEVVL